MGETLRSNTVCVVEQVCNYLDSIGALRKDRIEGLSDHFPQIGEIIEKDRQADKIMWAAGWKGWIGWMFSHMHDRHHKGLGDNFQSCSDELCLAAVRSLKELG